MLQWNVPVALNILSNKFSLAESFLADLLLHDGTKLFLPSAGSFRAFSWVATGGVTSPEKLPLSLNLKALH